MRLLKVEAHEVIGRLTDASSPLSLVVRVIESSEFWSIGWSQWFGMVVKGGSVMVVVRDVTTRFVTAVKDISLAHTSSSVTVTNPLGDLLRAFAMAASGDHHIASCVV
ncbi:hypothetical protein TREMEDRAFT_62578 [Tremella mesenterica DSM 1558]|uniref:uncharacterized protein n=1 Tax=Tremella mesenterica (strain ATCC 24925 / CBS 8224 / DSM 1558 / NBRC 9311 / NRRL Y-6157 / RJB 2259-6 / UBC 559-6) TaxID=578456 RepID=UPI0003F49F71|nr:uncharacterized protein TREMEDRAFT_62578 [Tremella mesenterica DSM 1558]EIW69709.1 hypothetical protein TREMEDRAFT_62578 [Tremella mesenterica DSM 1558]